MSGHFGKCSLNASHQGSITEHETNPLWRKKSVLQEKKKNEISAQSAASICSCEDGTISPSPLASIWPQITGEMTRRAPGGDGEARRGISGVLRPPAERLRGFNIGALGPR